MWKSDPGAMYKLPRNAKRYQHYKSASVVAAVEA